MTIYWPGLVRDWLMVWKKWRALCIRKWQHDLDNPALSKHPDMANQGQSTLFKGASLRHTLVVCGYLLMMLALVLVIGALVGSQRLPLTNSICAPTGASNCGLSEEQREILFDLRLPRILLAGAVGICLATAGAGYQALLRNPLAEPYLLGVSNGPAVGTMTALVFFGKLEWSRPVFALAGALIASFVVYQLARGRTGATPERLILAGVIVTTFLSSAIVFITTLMDATRIRSFTFWLLGDLSGTSGSFLTITFIAAAIGLVV